MCKVLGVSTSGYFAWEKRQNQKETDKEKWKNQLDERIKFHFMIIFPYSVVLEFMISW